MKRKILLLCIVILFTINSVLAQNSEEVPGFGEAMGVGPPSPPSELENLLELTIELKDLSSKNIIGDVHANLEIENLDTDEKSTTIRYVPEDGTFKDNLETGSYKIIVKVDDIGTSGTDYFAETYAELNSKTQKTVYMKPAGSVRGTVYKGDKVVQNARVSFECSANYGDTSETRTDDFGVFMKGYLPIGSCKISALSGKSVGSAEINIEASKLADIRIDLMGEVVVSYTLTLIIAVIIVMVLVGAYLYYAKTRKVEKLEEKAEATEKEAEPGKVRITKKMNDLLETLSDNEREVVRFLIDNNGKSTQAKIYHGTGIAKASLSRYVQNLKNKKIVRTKMLGKVKRVELTEWFLSD